MEVESFKKKLINFPEYLRKLRSDPNIKCENVICSFLEHKQSFCHKKYIIIKSHHYYQNMQGSDKTCEGVKELLS